MSRRLTCELSHLCYICTATGINTKGFSGLAPSTEYSSLRSGSKWFIIFLVCIIYNAVGLRVKHFFLRVTAQGDRPFLCLSHEHSQHFLKGSMLWTEDGSCNKEAQLYLEDGVGGGNQTNASIWKGKQGKASIWKHPEKERRKWLEHGLPMSFLSGRPSALRGTCKPPLILSTYIWGDSYKFNKLPFATQALRPACS